MATRKKAAATNGKRKRQSPSVERQIALALVRVIECVQKVEKLAGDQLAGNTTIEFDQARVDLKHSFEEAHAVLTANGYGDLESIQSRVDALENQLKSAFSLRDGKAITRLGAELERARTGRPPIAQPKKAKAPKETKTNNQPALLPPPASTGAPDSSNTESAPGPNAA